MIKEFQTVADYEGSVPSSQQTDVALVTSTNEVHVNGVNVVVPIPEVGDVVYLDERNKIVFVNGGSVQKERIPGVWTHVGYVYRVLGNKIGIIDKTVYNEQFQQVEKILLTGQPQTLHNLIFAKGGEPKTITIARSSSYSELVTQINNALSADADLAGWTASVGGGGIILQCAVRSECTFIKAPTMTDTKVYDYNPSIGNIKVCWRNTSIWAIYNSNLDRCLAYYSEHGSNWTYDEDISVPAFYTIVNESTFNENSHLAPAREYFGTYRNYIAAAIMMKEQPTDLFNYPFVDYSKQFADMTVELAGGGEVYVFPAIAKCNRVSYNNPLLAAGKWHLPGFGDMVYITDKETIDVLAAVSAKVGTSAFDNSIDRWTLAKSIYIGNRGIINGGDVEASVLNTAVAQAVTDIEI